MALEVWGLGRFFRRGVALIDNRKAIKKLTTVLEIHPCARTLHNHLGFAKADAHAASRAAALLDRGDAEGAWTWKLIRAALKQQTKKCAPADWMLAELEGGGDVEL